MTLSQKRTPRISMTKTIASTITLHFMAMFITRRSVAQSLLPIVMNGRVRGGVPHKTFTMRRIRCERGGGRPQW
jgi:hypothetical protein